MTKTIILLCLGFVCSFPINAQVFENIKVSAGKFKKEKSTSFEILGSDDTGYYVFKEKKSGSVLVKEIKYNLFHFNNALSQTKEVRLDLSVKKGKKNYESFQYWNDQLYLFTSVRNESKNTESLEFQTINKQTLQPNNDKVQLHQISYHKKNEIGERKYSFQYSPDSSMMFIYKGYRDADEKSKSLFMVLNKDLKVIKKKDLLNSKFLEKTEVIRSPQLRNNGNIYFLALKTYDPEPNASKRRQSAVKGSFSSQFKVVSIDGRNEEFNYKKFEIKEDQIGNALLVFDKEGRAICAGFFTKSRHYHFLGYFYLLLDLEKEETLLIEQQRFSDDLIIEGLRRSSKRKVMKKLKANKDIYLSGFHIRETEFLENGNLVVFCENYNQTKIKSITHPDLPASVKVFNYRDLLILNFDNTGKIQYISKIHRYEEHKHKIKQMSFFYKIIGKEIYVFFNEAKYKLYDNTDLTSPINLGHSLLISVKIDKDGNRQRGTLNIEPLKSNFNYLSLDISDNEVIILSRHKMKSRLVKMQIE